MDRQPGSSSVLRRVGLSDGSLLLWLRPSSPVPTANSKCLGYNANMFVEQIEGVLEAGFSYKSEDYLVTTPEGTRDS